MVALPQAFLQQMKDILNAEEFSAFCLAYENSPVRGVNISRLKAISENPSAAIAGFGGSDSNSNGNINDSGNNNSVPWCKTGYYYNTAQNDNSRPSKSVAYHAGLFYIQEPSAMCPAEVLGISPGQKVLDICAAPGGKSVQIAGHLRGDGLLVSNDASATRSRALVKNLERAGVTNAVVLTEQPMRLAQRFPEFFDRILVDAPCSGEGMFRRDADAVKAYTANKPEACAAVQAEILRHAATMLKPGGRLVYSTCTFNTTENENTITAFLQLHNDFSPIKIDHAAYGLSHGLNGLPEAARIWPHKAAGEGHFVALLQKNGTKTHAPHSRPHASALHLAQFTEFLGNFISPDKTFENIIVHGSNVFSQSIPINLQGLRVARSGWFLGEIAKDRFVPSHALAMGLCKNEARYSVELNESDAFRFLRGESLFYEEIAGEIKPWVLICHGGNPLGWARLVQKRLKNNLPVGWAIK